MQTIQTIWKKISFSKLALIVGLLTLLISMRSLLGVAFFRTHDFTHAARLVEMRTSLLSGEFPVRWSADFGFGYGMPLFNFYAPLPYYVGQLPLMMGLSPIDATKFLYLLNGILAFAGMYLFAKKLWGKQGGLISAFAFSFSTYRAVDLFVRGALGEAFAFVLLPFALYGILLMRERPKLAWLITSISLAAILLSHNLTGMISIVVLVCYWVGTQLVGVSKNRNFKRELMVLILTLITGISLSAFYVLPAFFEKGYTRVDQTIVVGDFDYHNHFLCATQLLKGQWKYGGSFPGCQDDISFALGTGALVLFGLGLVAVIVHRKRVEHWQMVVVGVGFLASAFMAIGRSVWIWDHVLLLKYFQFPWRFLTFTHVFLAAGIGACGLLVSRKWVVALISLTLVYVAVTGATHYWPEGLLVGDQLKQFYDTSPSWIRSQISTTLPDYMPPAIKGSDFPKPVTSRFSSETAVIAMQRDAPARVHATVTCQIDCSLTVNIFQFPGWRATLDGKMIMLQAKTQGLPIYVISIPSGTHTLDVELTNTPIRTFGNILSAVTVLLMVAVPALYSRKKSLYTV